MDSDFSGYGESKFYNTSKNRRQLKTVVTGMTYHFTQTESEHKKFPNKKQR